VRAIRADILEIKEWVVAVENRLSAVEDRLTGVEGRLGSVETGHGSTLTAISVTQLRQAEALDRLLESATTIAQIQNGHGGKLATYGRKFDSVNSTLDALLRPQGAISERLSDFERRFETMRA
jgi:hypothetical protein